MTLFEILLYTFLRDKLGMKKFVKNIGHKMYQKYLLQGIQYRLCTFSTGSYRDQIEMYQKLIDENKHKKEFIKSFFKLEYD